MDKKELSKILQNLKRNSYVNEADFEYIERAIIYKVKEQELNELKDRYEEIKKKKFPSENDFDQFKKFMVTYLTGHLATLSSS